MSDQKFESVEKSLEQIRSMIKGEQRENRNHGDMNIDPYILRNPITTPTEPHPHPLQFAASNNQQMYQGAFPVQRHDPINNSEYLNRMLRKEMNKRLPRLIDDWIKKNLSSVMEKRVENQMNDLFSHDDDLY